MHEYNPDAWVLLAIKSKDGELVYKVMGGWYGGYLGSDNWRLCSGIERIEFKDDTYFVYNYSGSVYKCYKEVERTTGLMYSIISSWQDRADENPELQIVIEIINMKEYYERTYC